MDNVQLLIDASLNKLATMPEPHNVDLRRLVLDVSDKRDNFVLWDARTRNSHNLDWAVRGIESKLGSGAHNVNNYRAHLRSHSRVSNQTN